MSLVCSAPALPEAFLPSRRFARMVVREGADGRETKTVSGGTAWQTERWAPSVTDIDVLSSSGNLAQRTGPYLEQGSELSARLFDVSA